MKPNFKTLDLDLCTECSNKPIKGIPCCGVEYYDMYGNTYCIGEYPVFGIRKIYDIPKHVLQNRVVSDILEL